jgi:hypothetical protein
MELRLASNYGAQAAPPAPVMSLVLYFELTRF